MSISFPSWVSLGDLLTFRSALRSKKEFADTEPVYFNLPFALNFLPNTSRNLRRDNIKKTICNLDFSYLDYLLYSRKRGQLLFFFFAISVKYLKFVYQFIVVVRMRKLRGHEESIFIGTSNVLEASLLRQDQRITWVTLFCNSTVWFALIKPRTACAVSRRNCL